MKCKCGFKFSGPGEFRNCNVELMDVGEVSPVWIVICPKCGKKYRTEG